MAQNAKITVHPAYEIGNISERLFSAFMEPIGTIVNGTMFNPKHPTADEQGFRRDFIDGLKKLQRGLTESARLDTLEPYFKIDVIKNQSGYEVNVSFYRFIEEKKDLDLFEVKTVFGDEELSLFISGLEEEYKPYPRR